MTFEITAPFYLQSVQIYRNLLDLNTCQVNVPIVNKLCFFPVGYNFANNALYTITDTCLVYPIQFQIQLVYSRLQGMRVDITQCYLLLTCRIMKYVNHHYNQGEPYFLLSNFSSLIGIPWSSDSMRISCRRLLSTLTRNHQSFLFSYSNFMIMQLTLLAAQKHQYCISTNFRINHYSAMPEEPY